MNLIAVPVALVLPQLNALTCESPYLTLTSRPLIARAAALALLALGGVTTAAGQPVEPAAITIPAGTPLRLVTRTALSSKTHAKGDLFDLELVEDVVIDGAVCIPKGARAVGELTIAEPKGAIGAAGKLEARLLYLVSGDRTIRIDGKLASQGKGRANEVLRMALAIGTIASVVTGESATIPVGTEVSGHVQRETVLAP